MSVKRMRIGTLGVPTQRIEETSRTRREGSRRWKAQPASPGTAKRSSRRTGKDRPGQTALSTQGCATVADDPGQSGPSLKLSRRSNGCQRFERVSRMGPKVHVVQSSKFPWLEHGNQATMPAQQSLRSANSPRAARSLLHVGGSDRSARRGLLRPGPGRRAVRRRVRLHHPVLSARSRLRRTDERPSLARRAGIRPGPLAQVSDQLSHSAQPGFLAPLDETPSPGTRNTSYRWGSSASWSIARLPSIVLGAVGCVAIFASARSFVDERTGGIAACPAGGQPALPSARPPGHVRGPLRGVPAARRCPGTLGLEILALGWTHRPEPAAA